MKNKFALLFILSLSLMFVSCGKNSFKGVWYFDHDTLANYHEKEFLKAAGYDDVEIIVYPDESKFKLLTSTGGDYKKMNEGKLGKYDWSFGKWYYRIIDKETGEITEGNLQINNGELRFYIDDINVNPVLNGWLFSRKNTSGSSPF